MFKMEFRGLDEVLRRLDDAPRNVRFAVSRALNDSVEAARTEIITKTWPNSVEAKNSRFIAASLTTQGQRATKDKLEAAIVDKIGHINLPRLEEGGTKSAKSGNLAIPTERVRRGANGAVVRSQLPRGLNPKNVVKKGNLIFIRVGRGKNSRLKLMYKLTPSARIKPTVPFHRDFNARVRKEMPGAYRRRLAEALRTAR